MGAPPTGQQRTRRRSSTTLRMLATGETWTLDPATDQPVRIGRDPDCDVPLPFRTISRTHAVLERSAGQWHVYDPGSRNGTVVNNEPVDVAPYPLRHGDQVIVGGVVTLEFEDPLVAADAPSSARSAGVWIDPKTARIWVDGHLVDPPLGTRQRMLLRALYRSEGRHIPLHELISELWPAMDPSRTDAIHRLVDRTSQRLRPLTKGADYLDMDRGSSIRLRPPRR